MYFSKSLVPAVYGSTNSKRMPFMDLLWTLTFMFILMSVPLSIFIMIPVVIDKLFAAGVNVGCLICKLFALNHFILELDVRQLVFQLGWVGSSDHLVCWCKSQFKYKVIVKSLWIKNALVGQDLMVEIYAILSAVNLVQFVFGGDACCFLSPEFEWILHKSSLCIPSGTMLSRFSPGKNKSWNIL